MKNVIKLEFVRGTCAICNTDNNELKSIERNYLFNHSFENYSDMFMKCFGIKLVNSEDKTVDVEICESCVSTLRSAASFRQLVEAAGITARENIPHVKNGKSRRKGVLNANKKPHSKPKQKSHGTKESTKQNEKVLQLTEIIVDNNDCGGPEANHQIEVKLAPCLEEFYDNLSILSDQSLSELQEHSNSVDRYDIFDGEEQVTDGESSTTSDQMRIATGYEREIERSKKKEKVIIPPLNITCKMCPICSQKFQDRRLLSIHYDKHFPAFVCEICGLSYPKSASYYNHRKKHLGISHVCPLCSKTFSSSSYMFSHIRFHHNKIKPQGCSECDARFSNSDLKRRHMAKMHGKECTTYQCSICKVTCYSSFKLNIHIKRSHDNIKSCFCTICDKGFYGNQGLKQHMVTHTDAGKYKCSECGKGFPRLVTLTEHLKIHKNIRDYVCELCQRAFVQKSALKTHMKVHTKISS